MEYWECENAAWRYGIFEPLIAKLRDKDIVNSITQLHFKAADDSKQFLSQSQVIPIERHGLSPVAITCHEVSVESLLRHKMLKNAIFH